MNQYVKRNSRKRSRNKDRDYVSGPILHKEIEQYYHQLDSTPEGQNPPEPSEAIIRGITQICNNLATRGNFSGYSYLDEMIGEGMVSCIAALLNRKYDLEKSNANPFAYFTRIAWNEFIQVIKREHKQSYLKHKELEAHIINSSLFGQTIEADVDDSGRLDKLVERFEGKKEDDVT